MNERLYWSWMGLMRTVLRIVWWRWMVVMNVRLMIDVSVILHLCVIPVIIRSVSHNLGPAVRKLDGVLSLGCVVSLTLRVMMNISRVGVGHVVSEVIICWHIKLMFRRRGGEGNWSCLHQVMLRHTRGEQRMVRRMVGRMVRRMVGMVLGHPG